MTTIILTDFSRNKYPDNELFVKGGEISDNLFDNPAFPTLNGDGETLGAMIVNLGSLLKRMEDGSRQVSREKKMSRKEIEVFMRTLANKVQDVTKGDEYLICGLGFRVRAKRDPQVLPLARPTRVEVKEGPTRGSLHVSWNVIPKTNMYEVKCTKAPSSETSYWSYATTSKASITLDNLVRGNSYAIQIAAAGTVTGRIWSDEIVSFVM